MQVIDFLELFINNKEGMRFQTAAKGDMPYE